MKFPSIKSKNNSHFVADKFTGTISSLSPSYISADKLSDSNNVWNADGVLTTRPGFMNTNSELLLQYYGRSDRASVFYADFEFTHIHGYNRLCALAILVGGERTDIYFYALNDSGEARFLFIHELVAANGYVGYDIKNMLFIKDTPIRGCGIFVLMPMEAAGKSLDAPISSVRYYELDKTFSSLHIVNPTEFYRPLIMKHGHGNEYNEFLDPPVKDTVYPEGVNILGGNFEADFSCDESSYEFTLPVSISEHGFITIEFYTSDTSKRTFTIRGDSDYSEEQDFMNVKLKFSVNRSSGKITSWGNNEFYPLPRFRVDNSLRIFAYTDTGDKPYKLLSRRAKPISFDRRLFFSGGETMGDRVFFSGKNQPLYYSEENSFTVGNDSGEVTALSQQNRYIIAFKEREMYRITLEETNPPDRDTLRDTLAITSVPVPKAKITRITNTIGCDRPLTIKTCGNRLVWYHSDGAVYTLYGSNLYTEGSVYELSREIKDKLDGLTVNEKEDIFAIDLNGYYCIAAKDKLFIMDCLVSGFHFLSGHKNADKNYSGLTWFMWSAPENTKFLDSFICNGKTYFLFCDLHNNIFYIATLSGDEDFIYNKDDDTSHLSPIKFSFTTALMGNRRKRIKDISFRAKLNKISSVTVFDDNAVICSFDIKGRERYCKYIIPLNYKIGKVGIEFLGEGNFSLEEIILKNEER